MYLRIALIIVVSIIIGCSGENSHEEDSHEAHVHETVHPEDAAAGQSEEEHNHEEIKVNYTVYSNKYEVFAESDLFIEDEEAEILAHFSFLPGFKPVTEGPVEMVLNVNGHEISETIKEPVRPGIFLFTIKPEISGSGSLEFRLKEQGEVFEVVIGDVVVYDNHKEAHEDSHGQEESNVNTVSFTKEQSWKIDFATAHPTKEKFGQVIKTVALVESNQQKEMTISSRAPGLISFTHENILEGIKVNRGELLFTIESEGLAEENMGVKIYEARNNYEKALANYERKKELAEEKVVSQSELLEAKNTWENAKLRYENLEENFNDGGQIVRSPMDGYIKQVFVENGQFAETGQPLLSIAQSGSLVLHAEIQQKYLGAMQDFETAHIRKMNENRIYSLTELNGKLLSYGRFASGDSYLLPVDIGIENSSAFIPGSFVEIFIKTSGRKEVVTVPNSALLEEQGHYFVFVQINPELFEKRHVVTGETDGIKTAVISGLLPEERIVTRGAMLIKLAQSTGALDAHSGHVH